MSDVVVKPKKLTTKERRYTEEFPVDFNATAAARRAGYKGKSENVLSQIAYRLLRKVHIQAAISERIDKLTEGADDLTKKAIQEATRLAFSDIRKFYNADGTLKPILELDDEAAACVASVEVDQLFIGKGEDKVHIGYTTKFKLWDKNSALDKLYRYLALYKDVGSKNNPMHVLHGRIDLNTLPIDELARIRDNPEYAAAVLSRN